MTLIIQKPTGAKLVMAQTYVGIDDPDAAAYITAVETADGQSLETAVKVAIHSFVKGCKNDGIWPAIKASCILAGARTLTGALVPLVGAAPTNVGGLFVSGDYNRETGLVGDGSTKYLDSNRNNNADPQNNSHMAVYATTYNPVTQFLLAGGGGNAGAGAILYFSGSTLFRSRNSAVDGLNGNTTGFIGTARGASDFYSVRINQSTSSFNRESQSPFSVNLSVFANGTSATDRSNARLAFYSIGESLDLALLDARVTDLINAFGAAIP